MLETNFNVYLNDNYPVYTEIKNCIEMLIQIIRRKASHIVTENSVSSNFDQNMGKLKILHA